jgi:hypothetical protein
MRWAMYVISKTGVKVLKNGELKTEPTLRKSKVRL